jgi:cobalt-precorrin-7 (C5)-methyltransferase
MAHKIIIVGIGPGSPDYLIPAAKREIEAARILVGSRRALDTFAAPAVETHIIDSDINGVLTYIKDKLSEADVVVLVSGDPGFYSMLSAIRRCFDADSVRVIPGISSTQIAFARISETWQDAQLISMHGRAVSDDALTYAYGKRLGILTDTKNNPPAIAKTLLSAGWPENTSTWVCANLSYPEEQVIPLTLREAADLSGFEHSVMVVIA